MCAQANPQGALHIHQLRGHQPGKEWQVNFTHMHTHKKLHYLLILVDIFTRWIEAFLFSRETADVMVQGHGASVRSSQHLLDNGTHQTTTNQALH